MPDPISWSFVWHIYGMALAAGYLCGSIPFGLILTQAAGLGDIRQIGSGNIGATNVLRTGNKGLAAATLLFDALKGLVPVLIAKAWFGPDVTVIVALGAFLGHLFPVWLGFKGGKGVAVALGILLGLSWVAGLICAAVWILSALALRYSSLAALLTAAVAPFPFWAQGAYQFAEMVAILALLVWLSHRANIERLWAGTEPRIGAAKAD